MNQQTSAAPPGPQDDTAATAPAAGLPGGFRQLRRDPDHKVIGGVCSGLGRYCDVDPVVFRVVIGVLAVTGGFGLIFYGFAWLLMPMQGEEESEGRRLLGGRVDGAALTAVFLALIGCGLFLTMLNSRGTLVFAAQLAVAAIGISVWSRRRTAAPDGAPLDAATAHAVSDAPPETKAPPVPESPSWWRDPVARGGGVAPPGTPTAYLWGPEEEAGERSRKPLWSGGTRKWSPRISRGPHSIGGAVGNLAVVACVLGIVLSWDRHPLGTSLQIGFTAALAVLGLGLALSSFLGRTGFGTIVLTVVAALLLAGSAALPKEISTNWRETSWKPASPTALQPRYELGSGVGTLDLSTLVVPPGQTLSTEGEVGMGKLKVVLPANAPVKLSAEAGVGDITFPDDPKNDIDISPGQARSKTLPAPKGAKESGGFELRLEVGVGQVEVTRAAS
ncbi:PspC domain-containing protein [Streptomyces sp. NPDC020412]|uniref:PspC domain-containing protein n=1 Tax=Streptomyces sp. NPDC020412 TaxID=3365073 RepID=UPI0037B58768